MTMTITGVYAAVLGILLITLRFNVIIERAKSNISILHEGNVVLAEKIRRFGNFVEVVPHALVLLAIVEFSGAPLWVVHGIGGALLVSRVLHPFGLDAGNVRNPIRIASGLLTTIAFVIAIIYIIWSTLLV